MHGVEIHSLCAEHLIHVLPQCMIDIAFVYGNSQGIGRTHHELNMCCNKVGKIGLQDPHVSGVHLHTGLCTPATPQSLSKPL